MGDYLNQRQLYSLKLRKDKLFEVIMSKRLADYNSKEDSIDLFEKNYEYLDKEANQYYNSLVVKVNILSFRLIVKE